MKNHNNRKIDSWELWERPACKDIQLNINLKTNYKYIVYQTQS